MSGRLPAPCGEVAKCPALGKKQLVPAAIPLPVVCCSAAKVLMTHFPHFLGNYRDEVQETPERRVCFE